jgi:fibronectin-binding autotransporter adhesin
MTVLTKRTARRALLASTALVAAAASMPAYAQSTDSPREGGTITYTGGTLTDTTTPDGGVLITDTSDVVLDGVTINTNTQNSGSFAAYEQRSAAGAGTSLTLRGNSSISGLISTYTDAAALSVYGDGDVHLLIDGGTHDLHSELGIGLLSNAGAVSLVNTGVLNITTENLGGSSSGSSGGIIAQGAGIDLQLGMLNLTSHLNGVQALGTGDGDISIVTTGGLIDASGSALFASSAVNGNVSVDSQSTINSNFTGAAALSAYAYNGNASVRTSGTGTIDVEQFGASSSAIRAAIQAGGNGTASIDVGAAIGSQHNGFFYALWATNIGTGGVSVNTSASVSSEYRGVYAYAATSGANTIHIGAQLTAGRQAIYNTSTTYLGLFDISIAGGVAVRGNTVQGGYATITTLGGTLDNAGTLYNGAQGTPGNGATIEQVATSNAAFSITNRTGGTINGGTNAITLAGSGLHSVVLEAGSTTVGNIVNSGAGTTNLTIGGAFQGSYLSTAAASTDTLTLEATGSMIGASLGDGNDSFVYKGGTVTGTIDGGAGSDTLTLMSGNTALSTTGFETIDQRGGTNTLTGSLTGITAITAGNGIPGGTLNFNGTGFTGTINVNGATIRALSAGAFGTGTITATDPTIQYGATGTYANPIVLASTDTVNDPTRLEADSGVTATLTGQISQQSFGQPLVIGGAGTIVLTNTNNDWSGGTAIEAGATLQGSAGAISRGNSTIANAGTLIFDESSGGFQNGGISGTGTLVKRGSARLDLSGANTYTGATTIEAGVLAISTIAGLGNSSDVALTGSTAILDATGISLSGLVLHNLSGVAGSQVRLSGKSATLTNSANTVFAGTLSTGFPNGTFLTKDGSGTLTLSGDTSGVALGVNVINGTLALQGTASLAGANYVRVDSGSFDISGISGTGSAVEDLYGAGGTIVLGDKQLTINNASNGNNYAGVISGTGGVTLLGGVATLAGANTYSGATVINSGTQLNLSGAGSLANSDVTANGFFQLLNADTSVHSFSGNGPGTFLNGYTLTIANGGNYSGSFGGGALNLTGGTLTLTGNNSMNLVTLNGGNFTLGDGGTDGYAYSANYVLTNGTLTINKADDWNVANISGGAGNLVQAGSGMLDVWNNSYTGSTTVTGGRLRLFYGSAIADTAELIIGAAGTAELFGSDETIGILSGAGNFVLNGNTLTINNGGNFSGVIGDGNGGNVIVAGGTLTLTGANTYTTTTIAVGAELMLGDGGTSGSVTGAIAVNGTLTANRSDSFTLQDLSGNGSFVQAGSGTTHIGSGGSGFTGTTTISAGTLALDDALALHGSSAVALTAAGTTLDLAGLTAEAQITNLSGIAGSTVRVGDGGVRVSTNIASTFAGGFVDASTSIPAVLTVDGAGTLTLTGQSGLSNAAVASGTLALTGTGSLGTDTRMQITGGTFDLSGVTDGSYTLGDLYGTGGTVELGATTLAISNSDPALMGFGGTIQGSGGLELAGGTFLLASGQLYTGDTLIDAGATLRLGGSGSFASQHIMATGELDLSGMTAPLAITELAGDGLVNVGFTRLEIAGNGGVSDFSGLITGNGGGVTIGSGTQIVTQDWNYGGTTTLLGNANLTLGAGGTTGSVFSLIEMGTGTLTVNRSNLLDLYGISGGGSFVQAGAGQTRVAGSSGFTGNVVIAAGTLTLTDQASFGNAASVALTGAGTVLNVGQGGSGSNLNNLSGVAGSTVNIGSKGLSVNNSAATVFAGTLQTNGSFLAGQLTKNGAATLTLTGQNAITGLQINSGTIALADNGTLGDLARVNLNTGTLDLSGVTDGSTQFASLIGTTGLVTLGNTNLTLLSAQQNFDGVIEGNGGLVIAGGSQALGGTNTYTGDTLIAANALLRLNGSGSIADSAVTVEGSLDLSGSVGQVSVAGLSGSGSVYLGSDWFRAGSNNADTSFDGTLANGSFWKDGLGTLTLTNASDLSELFVFEGTVAMAGNGSLGANAALNVGLGTFDISGISGPALDVTDLSGFGGIVLGDKTLYITNGSQSYGGVMLGSGGVHVTGGYGTFSGEQLYTGTTVIDQNTALYLVGFNGALTGTAEVNGTLDIDLHAGDTHIGGLNGTGSVFLGINNLTMTGGGSFSGVVSGDGGLAFAAGTSTLSGANNYAGTTTIDSGATLALAGAGTVGTGAVQAYGAFDIAGAAAGVSIANLSGTGTVALGGNNLTVGSNDQDSLFAGIASGTGGLTKVGSGVLTLSGANSYSGLTSVQQGTLQLGASGVLADDSTLEVLNGATLDMNGFDETVASFTIEGNLIGSGTLTAALYNFLGGTIDHDLGTGAIYQISGITLLNGSSAGSAVHVDGGTLQLGGNERLADTALVTVLAGATLDLQGYDETVGSLALAGTLDGTGTLSAGTYTLDSATVNANLGTGTLIQNSGTSFLNGTAAAGTVNLVGGTLQFGASDRLANTAAVTVASGTTLDLQGFNDTVGTLALAGTLDGTGTLSAGTYTLDSATVNANLGTGTLIQRSGTSFLNGTAASTTVNVNGGTLQLGAADRLADTAAVTIATGTTLDLQGFNDSVGTLALGGTLAGTGTLSATTYTLDGATVDANLGAGTLIQRSGTSFLNGTAGITTVDIDGGTLRLGASDRLADTAVVTVAAGTIVDLQGFNDSVGALALGGTLAGTGTLSAATYTLDSATVNANLGTGALVQRSGTSFLNGTTAAATVNIDGGTLQLGTGNRLADTAAVTVAAGTILNLQGFSDTVGSLTLGGTIAGTGTLTANSYVLDGATVDANLGTGTLIQHSGFSLLNGTAATGIVNVNAGTLRLGASDRLANTAAVTVAAGTILDLQGYNDTVGTLALSGTLAGTGTLSATTYTLNGAAIDANLSGGRLVQAGGTSVLLGTATGTSAEIAGGTLRIGDGGTSGAITGDIAVGGALVFVRSDAFGYAGALSGNGTVTQNGGTLTLSGNSSTFGGSFTAAGNGLVVTGQLGNANSSFAVTGGTLSGTGSIGGAVTMADGTHLIGSSGNTLSMGSLALSSGSIVDVTLGQSSSSALFAVGGNLTLDGTLNVTTGAGYGAGITRLFSYGGTLTDNGLALGTVTGTAASGLFLQTATAGQVNLVDNNGTTLAFWDGGSAAAHDNGQVNGGSGTWSLGTRNWTDINGTVNGPMQPVPSFAVFEGAGGTVTIDNGAGQVGATGMQFASNGYTLSGSALALSGAQAIFRVGDGTAAGANIGATIASALTGSSALVKTDLGTLVLTGANSYTGGTIVQAGTLIGNASSIQGSIQNAGMVVFDQAGSASFANAISGAGTMVKAGAGALTLTGTSSSNWQITAGSLISTSALFTGNADLAQGTSLVFDQAANGSYAGTLTGTGSLLFRGGGSVLLTGNSSAFAGTTTVGAGSMFSVNGTMGGMIDVAVGGRLQGSGTIGSVSIAGTAAPGNSIGTLTVTGNLNFLSGSTYEVEANASGQSDKIVVGGTATIANGARVSVLAADGNYAINTTYTILTATSGVTGTFSNVTSNLAFLTPTLAYSANAVTLNLKRNTIDFIAAAQTANQSAIAPAVQALGTGNGVYDAVVALTAPEARAAFDQLAGSDYASMRGRLMDDSRFVRDAVLARGSLAGEQGLAVWGNALGSWGSMHGGASAQGYDRDLKGFLAGFDAGFGGHWRAGLATGYGTSELRTGNATHKAESYHAGGYLAGDYGIASIQLGAAYAWNDVRSQRRVAFGGFAGALGDKYRADTFQAFGEVALKGNLSGVAVQPFAGLAYVKLKGSDLAEAGGAAALRGGTEGESMTWGSFGLRTQAKLSLGDTTLRFNGSAALRHAFGDTVPVIDLGFATGPGFAIAGNALDRDSASLDAGLELDLSKHMTLGVSYTGSIAERATDHGARAALSWRF